MRRTLYYLMFVFLFMLVVNGKTQVYADNFPECEEFDMEMKEEVAILKYNQLITEWSPEKAFPDDSSANYPDCYAGSYINSDKCLVIQITCDKEQAEHYFSDIIDLKGVVFEKAKNNYSFLLHEKESIKKYLENRGDFKELYSGIGISVHSNKVLIYTSSLDDNLLSDIANNIYEHTGCDQIEFTYAGKAETASTVYPGTAISNRSVGFWAKDGSGNLGVVTAPHSTISAGDTISISGTTFGIAQTPYFSGQVDAVFVKRTNSTFSPSRYVSGSGFSIKSNVNVLPVIGATIYSRGKVSLNRTGTVTDIAHSTAYGINNCAVATAFCQSGDSGGIVAIAGTSTSRYVSGIITGFQTSNNYLIFTKASNLLARLGVSIY